MRNAYKTVFRNNLTLKEAIAVLEAEQGTANDEIRAALHPVVELSANTRRGLAR